MNYKLLDLFCGAGGLSLGFEKAGFSVVKAIDIDQHAVNTYNLNREDVVAEVLDIAKVDDEFISMLGKIDGIIGHECINEILIYRLLSILGFHHLNYYPINANIKIDEAIINTYLCASYDFKEKGESKIALDTFFELKRKEKIRRILIVWLHYLIMDFLFYARLEKNK